jgi:protoporphyrin/coproporphyrin ferrochelatase
MANSEQRLIVAPAPAEQFDTLPHQYDALLIVSFGGPEGPDDVLPFLDNVLRGLSLPPPVKSRIAKRYEPFGGVSPINAHTRALIAALQKELDAHGPALPIYWGNRNWHPMLADTFERMAADGVGRAIAFVTSMFGSYNGCRKYREDLYEAGAATPGAPQIDRLRSGYNHPGFIGAVAERASEALAKVPEERRDDALIVFTAHSLPDSMARSAPYESQLRESSRLVAEALGRGGEWQLVYQSNNASYGKETWLGPDIRDALAMLEAKRVRDAVVVPIGFVCDHLEVVLDLDQQAAARARELGLNMVRAGTVGTHPAFVAMVRELITERMTTNPVRRALGAAGPSPDFCAADCCVSGRPGAAKPALCGVPEDTNAPRGAS